MQKEDLIIDLLKEMRDDQKDISSDVNDMKIDVALNRQDLEEHMAQTKAVKELVLKIEEKHNLRMDTFEDKLTVTHLLKLVVTVASGIGIVSGAIYGVIRILS